jgi:hypothetical protein
MSSFSKNVQQCDFLFVPTSIAESFSEKATLVVNAGIFLEIGLPLILDWLVYQPRRQNNSKAIVMLRTINRCSVIFVPRLLNMPGFIDYCMNTKNFTNVTMVHSVKIGTMGMKVWNEQFDQMQKYYL